MSRDHSIPPSLFSPSRLAHSVAAALGMTLSIGHADEVRLTLSERPTSSTHFVTLCDDTVNQGSLRYWIGHANSGDTIDLSQLPMSCSKVTLDGTWAVPE